MIGGRKTRTSIYGVDEGEEEGPYEDNEDGGPAASVGVCATHDGEDEVAAIMDDVVQSHYEERHSKADSEVDEDFPRPLSARGIQLRILDIEDNGKRARDGHCRGGNADDDGPDNLDLDVAEDGPVPPLSKVVVGPDENIDEDHEIVNGEIADQSAGACIACTEVENEGDDENEDSKERDDRNGVGMDLCRLPRRGSWGG